MKHVPNIAFTVALGCLAYGFWLAWPPLGWIVPASIVLWIVVRGYGVNEVKDA